MLVGLKMVLGHIPEGAAGRRARHGAPLLVQQWCTGLERAWQQREPFGALLYGELGCARHSIAARHHC